MELDVPERPSTSGRPGGGGAAAAAAAAATGVDQRSRFVLELEFVQCLANPNYLNWLAQNRYLEDPAFLNYLKYLEYWRQPAYAKYIKYPHCLFMLELLQREPFAKAITVPQVADEVHTQQYYHWQHYRANRAKEGTAALEQPAAGGGGALAVAAAAVQQQQQQLAQQQPGAAG